MKPVPSCGMYELSLLGEGEGCTELQHGSYSRQSLEKNSPGDQLGHQDYGLPVTLVGSPGECSHPVTV